MGAHISVPMYQRSIGQRYRMEGLKCGKCQKVMFPPKFACKHCGATGELEEFPLSGRGEVYSYTIIAGPGAPPEFDAESRYKGAYPVVLVELEDGPRIVGQLVECPTDALKIGMKVEMVVRKIYTEEEVIRYGFKFRPVYPGE